MKATRILCTSFLLFAQAIVAAAQTPPVLRAPGGVPEAATPGSDPAGSPETVLISNGAIALTRGDYEYELTRLPPEARGGFGTDPSRVDGVLGRMLVTRAMAAEARAAGIDKLPETQRRIAWEMERMLASMYVDRIDAEAAREFDARPGVETAARDRYLADTAKFAVPERASVTQIYFDIQKRGKDEALRVAQETRARILAGADMHALAREISDDPAAKRRAGRLDIVVSDHLDPEFTRAVAALKNPGDVSAPVSTRLGYHVIRLEARQPAARKSFAEVKDLIVSEMRAQYVEQKRRERMNLVRNDPKVVVNEAAVQALVAKYDPEAFKRALEQSKALLPQTGGAGPAPAAK